MQLFSSFVEGKKFQRKGVGRGVAFRSKMRNEGFLPLHPK
jgi:hypothetical protein